jgi:hypothetical protein
LVSNDPHGEHILSSHQNNSFIYNVTMTE